MFQAAYKRKFSLLICYIRMNTMTVKKCDPYQTQDIHSMCGNGSFQNFDETVTNVFVALDFSFEYKVGTSCIYL